jgi:3-deoxy-D-manno-octulosonic-acid transferase
MLAYSALLTVALVLSAPWWLLRMATTQRYREGLAQRLGRLPPALHEASRGKKIVWVHAVSVGEVLAATRLVAELESALGKTWLIVISTTTRTGHALAQERFGAERVFYMPLDFAFAVRAYLRALKPSALVLMESELWPRMVHECAQRGIPVAVVNARVSDRSFARAMKLRALWSRVLRKPTLWLAQSDEDARRLITMGARAETVHLGGNLKYDVRAPRENWVAELIVRQAAGRPIVVAGSTVGAERLDEERMVIAAWRQEARVGLNALLVLAPRHPERFESVKRQTGTYRTFDVSELKIGARSEESFTETGLGGDGLPVEIIVLDTIGDLAAVYAVADIAFVGGSLVPRGGHNPLEPAQFGVPVVLGPSYNNFRSIVGEMRSADGIRIVQDDVELDKVLVELLTDPAAAKAMGERGRQVFEAQQGATARAVDAIVAMIHGSKPYGSKPQGAKP